MLVIHQAILTSAALFAIYLTINGDSVEKRYLNSFLGLILNGAAGLTAFGMDIVKTISGETKTTINETVDNTTVVTVDPKTTVETLTYSSEILAIIHIVMALICVIFILTGAYDNISDNPTIDPEDLK